MIDRSECHTVLRTRFISSWCSPASSIHWLMQQWLMRACSVRWQGRHEIHSSRLADLLHHLFMMPLPLFLGRQLFLLLPIVAWMIAKPIMTLLVIEPVTSNLENIVCGIVVTIPCDMTLTIFTMGHTTGMLPQNVLSVLQLVRAIFATHFRCVILINFDHCYVLCYSIENTEITYLNRPVT